MLVLDGRYDAVKTEVKLLDPNLVTPRVLSGNNKFIRFVPNHESYLP